MLDRKALQDKYKDSRRWRQATKSYGFYVYPHSYYRELVEAVLKNK